MPIATTTDQTRHHQVVDPCLLGRPVHLLPQFASRLGEQLAVAMQSPGWRRSWSGFRVESVEFGRAPEPQLRWLGVATAYGKVAAAFERGLLLALLDSRYGRRGAAPAAPRDPATERVTATEERLAAGLTQQLAEVLQARVTGNLAAAGIETATAPLLGDTVPANPPGKAGWAIQVVVRALQSGQQGQFWLAPDQQMMASILQGLMPERVRPSAAGAGAEPLATSLQVKLDGRLVSKEITLAALFEMQVGDIIPVSLGRADVLLDESRLFTAAVSEHKGQLCLTSFEDAE